MIDKDKYWIAVDFDSVLMVNEPGDGHAFRDPIPSIVKLVKDWLAEGYKVKIFTARAWAWTNARLYAEDHCEDCRCEDRTIKIPTISDIYWRDIWPIKQWCIKHIGQELEVTCVKEPHLLAILDDRAIRVEANVGTILCSTPLEAIIPMGS